MMPSLHHIWAALVLAGQIVLVAQFFIVLTLVTVHSWIEWPARWRQYQQMRRTRRAVNQYLRSIEPSMPSLPVSPREGRRSTW